MNGQEKKRISIALLDLYEGVPNEGMRCIKEIIDHWKKINKLDVQLQVFDVRINQEVPSTDFDIYISSGGPGSPLDSEGSEWEKKYLQWVHEILNWNNDPLRFNKKHVFFICHSYQLACRHFEVASVTRRKSTAFGVFPVHMLDDADTEPIFEGLPDPFYAVDSRDYQVIKPNHGKLRKMGASILSIEKDRPHVPLERAVMAIRFNRYMIGTQFHPEADATGMTMYLLRDDKKKTVIDNHGEDKWHSMIHGLNDPGKILLTNSHLLPNFLNHAVEEIAVTN
ncbi:MAG: homoserine O-succinyltransferase [Chitinophagaceae bacterium]|nr:homoserine O-succinyltransferase [Chitinophagaceae bacterium]